MIENQSCVCPVCQVEKELVARLNEQASKERFQILVKSFPKLSDFPSAFDVLACLHGKAENGKPPLLGDEILETLIGAARSELHQDFFQPMLILAFIPMLHRTYREICVYFPTLSAEDVTQQVLATFLEVVRSAGMATQRGHLSVALARTVRRAAFQWAKTEKRDSAHYEWSEDSPCICPSPAADGNFESSVVLREFLDGCRRRGILSTSEQELLLKVKLEGFEAKELIHLRDSSSPCAVYSRLKRTMARLRQEVSAREGHPGSSLAK